jgi:hypothetical protein
MNTAQSFFISAMLENLTAPVVWWAESLVTDPEIPGPIAGTTRFIEN